MKLEVLWTISVEMLKHYSHRCSAYLIKNALYSEDPGAFTTPRRKNGVWKLWTPVRIASFLCCS
jgi:hypothetical protein